MSVSEKISPSPYPLMTKVMVADREYPIKVDNAIEEEQTREACKEINARIMKYQRAFSSRDTQDFLALAALENAIRLKRLESMEIAALEQRLNHLDERLDAFLSHDIDNDVL